MAEKFVYKFAPSAAEGNATMKSLLGGKGANLAEMCNLNIPVPPGFTITTNVCTYYYKHDNTYPNGLEQTVMDALAFIEHEKQAKFGSRLNPLLVSVRSGARESMPGMMDTVLNLGLNDDTVQGLIEATGDKRFAYDAYRRFVQMYGDVVMGVKPSSERELSPFEQIMKELKNEKGVKSDIELGWKDLAELVSRYKATILKVAGKPFPEDPYEQLWGAIGAVFGSWMNERAVHYRELRGIPHEWGTAVNVQSMVFGNMGMDSASGVGFTRDKATGEKRRNGEYLINAQGEDVVAGTRTPLQLTLHDSRIWAENNRIPEAIRLEKYPSLEEYMPDVFNELMEIFDKLELHYRDMQDVEFTIEKGRLYVLQTRAGKRSGFAACRIAVEMSREGLLTAREAILRVEPPQIEHLLRPVFDPKEKEKALSEKRLLAVGLAASPGAASGRIAFTADEVLRCKARYQDSVILVREETSPEDIKGMAEAGGILTARGGMTSHAAIVAGQLGVVCVAGCSALNINYEAGTIQVDGKLLKEGDRISIDGFTGEVIQGEIPTIPSEVMQVLQLGEENVNLEEKKIYQNYKQLMLWADQFRKLKIRTNADLPDMARLARALGGEGIGLCRSEHMFFEHPERLLALREMILADSTQQLQKALDKLLAIQRADFAGIFREMDGLPVTIRTLDPPLHEFLPCDDSQIEQLAADIGVSPKKIREKAEQLREVNPMLGFRGCRLGIAHPEITKMQARAIFEAAIAVQKEGKRVLPEIMIPLVSDVNELRAQKELIDKVANDVFNQHGDTVEYLVGTMIEVPRAAVTADKIAQVAEFFSFGTNDLTQTTFGFSRDDAGTFLKIYLEGKIFSSDPFATLDREGVGTLMKIAVERGRKSRPGIKLGICGRHGEDPASIRFCDEIGLDYVSCAPLKVPVAKLAAARAAIQGKPLG